MSRHVEQYIWPHPVVIRVFFVFNFISENVSMHIGQVGWSAIGVDTGGGVRVRSTTGFLTTLVLVVAFLIC